MEWVDDVARAISLSAESPVVAGLVGALAALFAAHVTNRRSDRLRREDRAERLEETAATRQREDVAAWRDKRLLAYGQWMAELSAHMSHIGDDVSQVMSLRRTPDDRVRFVEMADALHERRKMALNAHLHGMGLLSSWETVTLASKAVDALDAHWKAETAETPDVEASIAAMLAFMNEYQPQVREAMRAELGLPKDE